VTAPVARINLPARAWYGDELLSLPVPTGWRISMHEPRTPPPLSDEELRAALERPVGQAPIRELARGRRRPVIVVDDLSRPTPADRVLPYVLEQFAAAGIAAEEVTIVVGGGTHRPATREQLERKVGSVASRCRVLAHDCDRGVRMIGRTRRGSPVYLNETVAGADFLVGIGGVYPQHSVGFGGGGKLILGVLGKRSIVHLHYCNGSVAGTYDIDNDFRREVEEMAVLAGLRTVLTLHVDALRRIVRAVSGDHLAYYRDAADFSRQAYSVPAPGDADVVLVDAYPMDNSLTFTRSKGMAPLFRARAGASRIVLSACSEGIGHHGLFPFMNRPRFEKQIHIARRLSVLRLETIAGKVLGRARRALAPNRARTSAAAAPAASTPEGGALPAPGVRKPI